MYENGMAYTIGLFDKLANNEKMSYEVYCIVNYLAETPTSTVITG